MAGRVEGWKENMTAIFQRQQSLTLVLWNLLNVFLCKKHLAQLLTDTPMDSRKSKIGGLDFTFKMPVGRHYLVTKSLEQKVNFLKTRRKAFLGISSCLWRLLVVMQQPRQAASITWRPLGLFCFVKFCSSVDGSHLWWVTTQDETIFLKQVLWLSLYLGIL